MYLIKKCGEHVLQYGRFAARRYDCTIDIDIEIGRIGSLLNA